MARTPGTRFGVYEVTAQIGEGGMGQVYRAHDTKLKRDIALKILPDACASDPDLSQRIVRGPIPRDEALPIAKQIAEALEAARTGHNNDQGGRRLWIRSDARY